MLQSMESQRVGHDLVTKQHQQTVNTSVLVMDTLALSRLLLLQVILPRLTLYICHFDKLRYTHRINP